MIRKIINKSLLLLTTLIIMCSQSASCSNTALKATIEDNTELLPGVVYKDNRITGEYQGVTINASYYDEGFNADVVYIYRAHYVDRTFYDKDGFNSGVLTFKEAANDDLNRDYYTDPSGVDYLVDIDENENGSGFYCAEICRLCNDGASRFLRSINNDFDNDYTEVLTHMSHIRPDNIPEDKALPTDFDYWEVLTFSDGSSFACRDQSIDGIPILDGYSPRVIKWSEQYKGMGMEAGEIKYKKTTDYWYVFDARRLVSIDKDPIDSCKVKDIDDCFEEGVKGISSEIYLYGKDPVLYDVAFGYIMVAEYDPQQSPPIWSDDPDPIGKEYATVPVWRFKAYYPATNLIYSTYVNASTGESLW